MTLCISSVPSCGWSPDEVFECPHCERTVCYCQGCCDDMPAVCDDCWFELEDEEAVA
jgi:hypothetical protein